jgi:hypothetical protein
MAILIDNNTRVLIQGITGVVGSFQTRIMQEYGTILGFDFGAVEKRSALMNYSADSGRPSISEKVLLPIDKEKFGFLVFSPIYNTGASIESIEERRENLEGFVVGLISIKELIEESLGLISTRGVEIQLYDLEAASGDSFIYGYIPGQSSESVITPKAAAEFWNDE